MRFTDLAYTVTLFAISRDRKNVCTRRAKLSPLLAATVESIDAENIKSSEVPNKYQSMLEWLKSKEDAYVSDKIALMPSKRGGGYGAFVVSENDNDDDEEQQVIEADELIFKIPRSSCITLDAALADKDCGEGFQKIMEKAGPGGNTVVLAGFLAKERLNCLKSGSNDASEFGSYLATLPWERGVNSQEHILYWDDDLIESTLKGSMCYGEAKDIRAEVALATRVLNSIVGRAFVKQEEQDGFRWPWERKERQPIEPVEGFADAMKGAFVSVLTRAFQDDYEDNGDDREKLVPLLDMLQHSDIPNVSHAMRKIDGTVEVRARRSLKAGEELVNQYRAESEETMPYHRFFTRYGFVPGIMEPIENLFADKSSIFFAQKAEV